MGNEELTGETQEKNEGPHWAPPFEFPSNVPDLRPLDPGIVPLYVAVGNVSLPEIETVKQMSRTHLENTCLMFIEKENQSVEKINDEAEEITENPVARARELWDTCKVLKVQCTGHPYNKSKVIPVQLGAYPKLGWMCVRLSDFNERPYGDSQWLPSIFLRMVPTVTEDRSASTVSAEKSIIAQQETEISYLRKRIIFLKNNRKEAPAVKASKKSAKKDKNPKNMKQDEFNCNECSASYTTDGSLRNHRYRVHGPKAKKICPICHDMRPAANYAKHLTVQSMELFAHLGFEILAVKFQELSYFYGNVAKNLGLE